MRDVAAALLGAPLIPFIGEKPLQRGQQKRAETAPVAIGVFHPAAFQEAQKEGLGKILGVMSGIPASADIGVKRIPVVLAKPGERIAGPGGVGMRGRQNHRPVGGGKHGPGLDRSETGVLGGGHAPGY